MSALKSTALYFGNEAANSVVLGPPELNGLGWMFYTVELWVQINKWQDGQRATILSVENDASGDELVLGVKDKKLLFETKDGNGNALVAQARTELELGSWYHVAWVRGDSYGRDVRFYINGRLDHVHQNAMGGAVNLGERGETLLGRRSGNRDFEGAMTELRIWSRDLSQKEIRSRMYRRLTELVDEPEVNDKLGAYWPLMAVDQNKTLSKHGASEPRLMGNAELIDVQQPPLLGDIAKALSFAGVDDKVTIRSFHVEINTQRPQANGDEIALWLNTQTATCGVLTFNTATETDPRIELVMTAGVLSLQTLVNNEVVGSCTCGENLADGRWHFVRMRFSSKTAVLAVDQGSSEFEHATSAIVTDRLILGEAGAAPHYVGSMLSLSLADTRESRRHYDHLFARYLPAPRQEFRGIWSLDRADGGLLNYADDHFHGHYRNGHPFREKTSALLPEVGSPVTPPGGAVARAPVKYTNGAHQLFHGFLGFDTSRNQQSNWFTIDMWARCPSGSPGVLFSYATPDQPRALELDLSNNRLWIMGSYYNISSGIRSRLQGNTFRHLRIHRYYAGYVYIYVDNSHYHATSGFARYKTLPPGGCFAVGGRQTSMGVLDANNQANVEILELGYWPGWRDTRRYSLQTLEIAKFRVAGTTIHSKVASQLPHHAEASGDVTYVDIPAEQNPIIGYGVRSFTGNTGHYLTYSGIPEVQDYSFEVWVNPETLQSTNTWPIMGLRDRHGRAIVKVYLSYSGGKLVLTHWFKSVSGSRSHTDDTPIPFHSWTHVAVSHDGTSSRLHVNGVFVGSEPHPDVTLDSAPYTMDVGKFPDWGQHYRAFGKMCGLKMWKTSPSEEAIAARMHKRSANIGRLPHFEVNMGSGPDIYSADAFIEKREYSDGFVYDSRPPHLTKAVRIPADWWSHGVQIPGHAGRNSFPTSGYNRIEFWMRFDRTRQYGYNNSNGEILFSMGSTNSPGNLGLARLRRDQADTPYWFLTPTNVISKTDPSGHYRQIWGGVGGFRHVVIRFARDNQTIYVEVDGHSYPVNHGALSWLSSVTGLDEVRLGYGWNYFGAGVTVADLRFWKDDEELGYLNPDRKVLKSPSGDETELLNYWSLAQTTDDPRRLTDDRKAIEGNVQGTVSQQEIVAPFLAAGGGHSTRVARLVNSRIHIERKPTAIGNNAFTVELWAKGSGWLFGVHSRGRQWTFSREQISWYPGRYPYSRTYGNHLGQSSPDPARWHHYAVAYDGTDMRIYIDGVLNCTQTEDWLRYIGVDRFDYKDKIYLGHYQSSLLLAEVRLWSEARSQQQIQDNLYERLGGTEEQLLGYWHLEEHADSTNEVQDKSGNLNHGRPDPNRGKVTFEPDYDLPLREFTEVENNPLERISDLERRIETLTAGITAQQSLQTTHKDAIELMSTQVKTRNTELIRARNDLVTTQATLETKKEAVREVDRRIDEGVAGRIDATTLSQVYVDYAQQVESAYSSFMGSATSMSFTPPRMQFRYILVDQGNAAQFLTADETQDPRRLTMHTVTLKTRQAGEGSTVTVSGVEVPKVVGFTSAVAKRMLQGSDLNFRTMRMSLEDNSLDIGKVVRQVPQAGESVLKGTPVSIFIGV